jgi:hypothetical protein
MPLTIESTLNAIKILHTVIWAAFVSCILAIWLFAWQAEFYYATLSIGIVCVEVLVLMAQKLAPEHPKFYPPAARGLIACRPRFRLNTIDEDAARSCK